MIPIRRRLYQSLAGFSPRQLFAALQGAWLEPVQGAIWQENTGVTPTTTGGQTIGWIADQSGGGNNATQSTASARPLLGRRYNTILYSEDFSNAEWVKSGVDVTGSSTLIPTTASSSHHVRQTTLRAGNTLTFQAKAAGYNTLAVSVAGGAANRAAYTLTGSGSVSLTGAVTASISSIGDGWYACSFTYTESTFAPYIHPNAYGTFAGDGTSGVQVRKVDLRLTSDVGKDPAYQRITTATDYDYGQYPAAVHDATDSLVVSLPNLGSGAYSASGSVYFATPVGMSALHNQSIGTSYTLPALSTDIYSWIVVPQRLSTALEGRLERYMLRKAGLAVPDYLTDDSGSILTDDIGDPLLAG